MSWFSGYPKLSASELEGALAQAAREKQERAARLAAERVAARPAPVSSATDWSGWGGSKWIGGLAYPGQAPTMNHALLRGAARKAYHRSLEARAVIERHCDTVADTGLRLAPAPDADVLGIDPEIAEQWAAAVGSRFDQWAKSRTAIRQENMNFYQAQRLAAISQQRDGEYFVRFFYNPRRDLLNPLQLGFIDPGQINGQGFTYSASWNAYGGDGIERDPDGREIAYNIYVYRPDGKIDRTRIPAFGDRSRRRMMVHGYQPEYAGQGRGYSRLSHALQEFENITDFKASEVKKAIAQSSITMFTEPSKEQDASNPLELLARAGPAGPSQLTGVAEEALDEAGLTTEDIVGFTPLPEATIAVPGSVGIFNLKKGETFRPFPNTAPVESFSGFVTSLAASISASMSIPLEVVLMKFNQNYSASRAALILFWRVAQIWRDEMVSDFLQPAYESWLAGEIAAGRIFAPGWSDPRMRAAWLKASWIGAPMPNIDPQKTATADQLYATMGATTLDRIALGHNGSSGTANRAQLAREFAELPSPPWKSNPKPATSSSDDGGPEE